MGSTADESRFGLVAPAPAPRDACVAGAGRAHARHEVRLRAEVSFDGGGGPGGAGHQGKALVENIGFGGACLAIDAGPSGTWRDIGDIGAMLRLSLVAPSLWDPLVLTGRIVWIDDRAAGEFEAADAPFRRLGVAFVHEKPRAVLALHDLISTLAYE